MELEYKYGPKAKISVNNPGLVQFINDCDEYISSLSEFDEYCVWRYTIGSASINKFLIFKKYENNDMMDDNSTYWVYLFFLYWKTNNRREKLPNQFIKFGSFFKDPQKFVSLNNKNKKSNIVRIIIMEYINTLQRIILGGPLLSEDIIVYKVSSLYPGLPSLDNFIPTVVYQDPFNSTTINKTMNFEMFIGPGTSAIFKMLIPAGTKGVLYVPTDMHAYGDIEREILLPYGCSFDIFGLNKEYLTYVDPSTVKLETLQNKRKLKVGIVYSMNAFEPCKSSEGTGMCIINSKLFDIFECLYQPPK